MADSPANARTNQPSRTRVRGAGRFQDQLSEEYTIDTPENVTFGYEVAGIGSRFVAALIDSLILGVLLLGLNIALIVALAWLGGDSAGLEQGLEPAEDDWVAGLVIALYALLNFGIMWGYYLLFEWLWHGQTIGKRSAHIRVVRSDGAPVGFVPIAVRNLVRIVDFLPTGYAVGVITMFCNRQARRLGDFAAGTLVVKDQGELSLDALMTAIPTAPPTRLRTELPAQSPPSELTPGLAPDLTPDQDWSTIRRLTAADYELVQETLARYRTGKLDSELLQRVATAIATKLEHEASSQLGGQHPAIIGNARHARNIAFLESVAAAYGRWVR